MALPRSSAPLLSGFADTVGDAQRVFKAVMGALARPGCHVALDVALAAPAPLRGTAAAILLALADYETPVALDGALQSAAVAEFLSFHTGAQLVPKVQEATFVVTASPASMPPLASLRQGTPEYPDRSATLIVQVDALEQSGLTLEGPGIDGRITFGFTGITPAFAHQLAGNRAQFPCGIDIIFAAPGAVAALPRSVRLVKEE